MKGVVECLEKLIEELGRLPGVGRRSAERYAYHLMAADRDEAMALARAIHEVKKRLSPCKECFGISENELCAVCSDLRRDKSTICVVEEPRDMLTLEATGVYKGVYHVLMGRIAPLEDIGPEDLTLEKLLERVRSQEVREVILATNPTVEGEATANYIVELLAPTGKKVTKIATGISSGSRIEYVSSTTLSQALSGRHLMK